MIEFLLFISICLSLFSNVIDRVIPFNYFDELVFGVFLICGLIQIVINRKRIPHNLKAALIWFVAFLFMCGLSTVMKRYQTNPVAILKDIVGISKFPIIAIFGCVLFNKSSSSIFKRYLINAFKFFTIVIFAFGILNLFIEIGMSSEIRHGLKTYRFLYTHETTMVSSVVVLLAVLATQKLFNTYVLLNLITLFLSGRDKAYVLIFVYLLILIASCIRRKSVKKPLLVFLGVCAAGIVVALTYDKLTNDYLKYGTTTARLAFIIHGFEFANDSFPLGTGFATWANSPSGEYYSVLYHIKEMEQIYGIELNSTKDFTYWNDTFWPTIYTEGGYIGLLSYVMMLVFVFKHFYSIQKSNSLYRNSLLVLFGYAVIASFLESYFTNDSGVLLSIICVALYNKKTVFVTVHKTEAIPLNKIETIGEQL